MNADFLPHLNDCKKSRVFLKSINPDAIHNAFSSGASGVENIRANHSIIFGFSKPRERGLSFWARQDRAGENHRPRKSLF